MQPTRRALAVLGVGATLAVLSVLLQSPFYLYGAIGVGAWVVAEAVAFGQTVRVNVLSTTVSQRLSESTTQEGRPVQVVVTLTADEPVRGLSSMQLSPPLSASHVDGVEQLHIDEERESYSVAGTYEFDVTGEFEFDLPEITVESHNALFVERATVGDTVTCTVEPSTPTDVAIGQGGNRVSLGIGDHDAQVGGSGFKPGDLRQYIPGDPQSLIDWKTTARQGEPYVREYESAGELETLLFVDHRGTTAVGPDGRRALDYLRSVTRWLVDYAQARDDPLGFYAVGDDGPTVRIAPSSESGQYRRLGTRTYDLEPTGAGTTPQRQPREPLDTGPLDGDSQFERVLSAFVGRQRGYIEHGSDDSLFDVVRSTLSRTGGDSWVVVLTTDEKPAELADTVRAASKRAAHVTAFVAPTVLFEPGSLGDLDAAYDRYTDFERFRSRLVGETVDVYEVAPGERLNAVLASARNSREGRR